MMKAPRNERTAHAAMHLTADHRGAEAAQWQRVLQQRDTKRDARRAVRAAVAKRGALVTFLGYSAALLSMVAIAACQHFGG